MFNPRSRVNWFNPSRIGGWFASEDDAGSRVCCQIRSSKVSDVFPALRHPSLACDAFLLAGTVQAD